MEKKYGITEQEAFKTIKKGLIDTIAAAQNGELDKIQKISLDPVLKWKVAFIYQNHSTPILFPIYQLKTLQAATNLKSKSHAELYKLLMEKRVNQTVLEYGSSIWNQINGNKDENEEILDPFEFLAEEEQKKPLNQILAGPPGSGKTYNTIDKTLEIIDISFSEKNIDNRKELKKRFDQYVKDGQVAFVTFHQSFSYEDFVEGLRADTNTNGNIEYRVEPGIFKILCDKAHEKPSTPFVLIIDEINRGNVSRIFGELITLIESSKRSGSPEALSTILPYSKESFSVPNNLYIIGTMNTADRSLANIDIALRRRFEFEEILPKPDLLKEINIEEINIGELLETINKRIELLIGSEYCIGHAWFMSLENDPTFAELKRIFRQSIIPLMQEYFFDDWQRIAWILNDHRKSAPSLCFIQKQRNESINLFGDSIPEHSLKNLWTIQESAFTNTEAYNEIINSKNNLPS